jgi:GH18 family chitinase
MVSRVIAFLPSYATVKTRGFDIATIPGDRITDLIYCFGGFQQQPQSWLPTFPEPDDTSPGKNHNVAKLIALKTRWPALNVVMSIGGWNHSHDGDPTLKTTPAFSAVAATPQSREAFVAACVDLFITPVHPVIGLLFGGIDLDWEYPRESEWQNLFLLLGEFRSQLDRAGAEVGRHLTLSACWGAGRARGHLGPIAELLDWFNLMTYNAHHPNKNATNQVTDFEAPLLSSPNQPAANFTWTIDQVVQSFLAAAVPASKLAIGIGAYAHTYAGVPNINNGLYQTYTGPGPGSLGKPELLEYKELVTGYLPKYDSHWDDAAKCSYLYNPQESIWISYESVRSLAARADYANQKGVGGLFLWELGADAPSSLNAPPGSSVPALIDAMPHGIAGFANKTVARQTTDSSPVLAFRSGYLFLASKRSSDNRLEVSLSSNNGATFGGTYISSETSDCGPALAAHNGKLMIAWKDSGNDNLSVAEVGLSADSQGKVQIDGLINKTVLSGTSDTTPALASHAGGLFLAWKGSGNANLGATLSIDNGATFGSKYISPETSDGGPALAPHAGKLMIAWKGSSNDNLSVAQLGLFTNTRGAIGIEGFTKKLILSEISDRRPALASDGRRLFLAWKGSGNDNLSVTLSRDGGASFSGKYFSPETSDAGPALASDGSQVPIAWKGSGNFELNIAQLAFF